MKKPDQPHALTITAVSKNFSGVQAVRSVSFEVPVGERRALIGPNGAGKTTLFNTIAGELVPNEGSIHFFGIDITRKSVQKRANLDLGRTYQISQLFLDLTVEENLYLAGSGGATKAFRFFGPWKNNKAELDWVQEVTNQVGLHKYISSKVSELSHGLQRQLEIGMALAMHPRLIMLDEPAAGLSPSERIILTDLIKKLPRDVTLILIEHDMEIVLDIADRITVMYHGSVIAEGTPGEIRSNVEVKKVYLGSSYV
ncbi:MAG: ABC transporter ATP-binding protein [Chloroflexi bacterium HGW-Chloroflexi-3]|nr:MAG: ABC transporter ATP-binding protein [Chloroflexi bacterium HGW-Chloroflexi-3]